MNVNIEQLTQFIKDEFFKNLEVTVIEEDYSYEPHDVYKITFVYDDKAILKIDVPTN